MGYRTVDELDNFDFHDAIVGGVEIKHGHFFMYIECATIKADNSCNRDICDMGAGLLSLKIQDAEKIEIIREGYKHYNADGKLLEEIEDEPLSEEAYNELYRDFNDEELENYIYSIEKKDGVYVFIIEAYDGATYLINIKGSHDVEEWERFIRRDGM